MMVTRLGPLFTSGHRVHGVTASAGQKRGDVQIVNYSTLACHTHTECKGTLHGEGANPLSGHAPPVINIHIYQSIACAHTPADRLACLACHARHHSAHPARPCHHHCHASPDSTHDRRPLRNARVNGLVLLTDAAGILGTVTEGDNTKQHSPRLRLRAGPLALGLGFTM